MSERPADLGEAVPKTAMHQAAQARATQKRALKPDAGTAMQHQVQVTTGMETTTAQSEGGDRLEERVAGPSAQASTIIEPLPLPEREGPEPRSAPIAELPVLQAASPAQSGSEPSTRPIHHATHPVGSEQPASQPADSSLRLTTSPPETKQHQAGHLSHTVGDQPSPPKGHYAVQRQDVSSPAAGEPRLEPQLESPVRLESTSQPAGDQPPSTPSRQQRQQPDEISAVEEGSLDNRYSHVHPPDSITSWSPVVQDAPSHRLVSRAPLRRPLRPLLGKRGIPSATAGEADAAEATSTPVEPTTAPQATDARSTYSPQVESVEPEPRAKPPSGAPVATHSESQMAGTAPPAVQRKLLDAHATHGAHDGHDAPDTQTALHAQTAPDARRAPNAQSAPDARPHSDPPADTGGQYSQDTRATTGAQGTTGDRMRRDARLLSDELTAAGPRREAAPISRAPEAGPASTPGLPSRRAGGLRSLSYSGRCPQSDARAQPHAQATEAEFGSLPDPESLWSAPTHRELPLADVATPGFRGTRPASGTDTLRPSLETATSQIQDEPVVQRQAEDSGTSEPAGAAGAEGEQAAGTELETMARQVYDLLRRRLRVEQERAKGWVR